MEGWIRTAKKNERPGEIKIKIRTPRREDSAGEASKRIAWKRQQTRGIKKKRVRSEEGSKKGMAERQRERFDSGGPA